MRATSTIYYSLHQLTVACQLLFCIQIDQSLQKLILVINWRGMTDPSSFSPFERKVILIGWCVIVIMWCIIVIMGSIYFGYSIRQMKALQSICCKKPKLISIFCFNKKNVVLELVNSASGVFLY